jgi:MFS family permease
LASISLIQEVAATAAAAASEPIDGSGSCSNRVNTMVSILILVRLLPNVFFMPLGGVLADKYDRRMNQIVIDLISSLMVLLFLLAVQYKSIPILYIATFCQESLSGLYLPNNTSIVPLLVSSEAELEKATTLSSVTWSLVAAMGSSLGGAVVAVFGVRGCFVVDSMTYLLSAAFLAYGVKGSFVATEEEVKKRRSTIVSVMEVGEIVGRTQPQRKSGNGDGDGAATTAPATAAVPKVHHPPKKPRSSSITIQSTSGAVNCLIDMEAEGVGILLTKTDDLTHTITTTSASSRSQLSMFLQGIRYAFVIEPTVGAYALLKGSAALTYGGTDVLNVAFSALGSSSSGGDVQQQQQQHQTSIRLGILFACVGIGCIIGSTLCDVYASLTRPQQIVPLGLSGFALMSFGCLLMGLFPQHFVFICVSGIIRSTGSSLLWICSTLLVQKYSPPTMLGRIQSIDLAAGLFGEASSAMGGGLLLDNVDGFTPERLALVLAGIAFASYIFWNIYLLLILKPPSAIIIDDDDDTENDDCTKTGGSSTKRNG